VLAVLTLLAACSKKNTLPEDPSTPIVIAPPPDFGFKVIGYMPNYRDPATIPDAKFRMTNVINYAFATVNSSGIPVVNNATRFQLVVNKTKVNNAKIFISVNGSTANWKTMAVTATGRNTFIKSLMNILRQYQLDGADIDWEFPSTADSTDITYTALMKELSDSCHFGSKYYLTAAITAGKYSGGYRDAIKAEVFGYVDWMNIMAYDDFNTTVAYRQHSPYELAVTCLNYWLNTRGLPKAKCVLGLPAYGRPSGITQTNTTLAYASILQQGGSAFSDSALVTSSGWATPYMIYYNGKPTIKRKTMLAQQRGNGVMIWEKGQDSHDGLSLLKAVCDTIGRTY
jgi:GH18 family chitinase